MAVKKTPSAAQRAERQSETTPKTGETAAPFRLAGPPHLVALAKQKAEEFERAYLEALMRFGAGFGPKRGPNRIEEAQDVIGEALEAQNRAWHRLRNLAEFVDSFVDDIRTNVGPDLKLLLPVDSEELKLIEQAVERLVSLGKSVRELSESPAGARERGGLVRAGEIVSRMREEHGQINARLVQINNELSRS